MSLSENLHNLGALMKTNLEKKGIDGLTGNEGLTTLANKILDIKCNGNVIAYTTEDNIYLGDSVYSWLITIDDVVIDWGDGTSNTVNNPREMLSHTYDDTNGHLIIFDGTVTSLGTACFMGCSGLTFIVIPNSVTSLGQNCFRDCSNLTSIVIPNSVTSLGQNCFRDCSNLTSIVIPDSVTSIGDSCFSGCSSLTNVVILDSVTNLGSKCFYGCTNLIDYQLYWETQPIQYDSQCMPVSTDTVFTIPYGTTSIYVDAGYPSDRLLERENLVLSSTTPSIRESDIAIITVVLTLADGSMSGETLNYVVKHGDSVLDSGILTTNEHGEGVIGYIGTGIGDVSVEVSYRRFLQKTYVIQDGMFKPPLDGTDDITKWSTRTNKTENGVFTSHGSFLTNGWSNNGLWQLDFDVQCSRWWYVGLMMFCDARINPYTDTKNVNYSYTTWEGLNYGGGFNSTIVSQTSMNKIKDTAWHHYTVTKLSDTQVKVVIDEKYTAIINTPNLINAETLHIGSRDNSSSRSTGETINLKNIEVQYI